MQTGRIGSEAISRHTSLYETGRKSAAGGRRAAADGAAAGTAPNTADSFIRAQSVSDPYAGYTAEGRSTDDDGRILPPRYYETKISGNVYYKGGTIPSLRLLEEAVRQGAVVPDESKSIWANIEDAHRALIYARAVQPYKDVSSLYSEDGQYRFRVENGQITGETRAFYIDKDGRRITAQYLAEQLASGVAPPDLDGDWSFLAHLDNELYTRALEIGNAKRSFEQIEIRFENREITQEEYLDEIHPYLLFFLGRDKGRADAKFLRELLLLEDFGRKALEGTLADSSVD